MKDLLISIAGKIAHLTSHANKFFLINKRVFLIHSQDLSNILPLIKDGKEIIYFSHRFHDSLIKTIPGNHKLYSLRNKINFISLFFRLVFYKLIILNDSTNPIGVINFHPKQKIIQLWHACGAFKKFGHESHHNKSKPSSLFKMYPKYTSVIVSSNDIRHCYASSFSIDIDKILPLGLPRTDVFFNKRKIKESNASFYLKYPYLKDKKIFLYAPTYREFNKKRHYERMKTISIVANGLKSNQVLIYSLHPFEQTHTIQSIDSKFNFTNEPVTTQELLLVADTLITDYSSVIFDFCLLDKPMFFFPYDLESYESEQRGFFFPYNDLAPGPICNNAQDLLSEIILQEDFSLTRSAFKKKFMSGCDGNSTKRLLDHIQC